jgi:hypothetical protein
MKSAQHSFERAGVIIIALHLLVSLVHGAAHSSLHIDMALWQTVYILVVITIVPLGSGVLLWRRSRIGFLLLLGSMLGALIFGGYYHFIAAGIDNVATVGSHSWGPVFRVTAVLLGVTEAAGALTGVAGLLKK